MQFSDVGSNTILLGVLTFAGNIHHQRRTLPAAQRWYQQRTCLARAGWAQYENVPLVLFRGVGQQTKFLAKQNAFCLRWMSIHKILFCKWIWKMIHLSAQIYYQ